jgi:hypothetical protein
VSTRVPLFRRQPFHPPAPPALPGRCDPARCAEERRRPIRSAAVAAADVWSLCCGRPLRRPAPTAALALALRSAAVRLRSGTVQCGARDPR